MTARDFSKPGLIYVVTDAREPDRVRYVGRTIQPLGIRVRSHWYEAMKKRSKFQNWLRARSDRREEVIFTPISWHEDGHDLNRAEIAAIEHYRSIGQADMNLTSGGDGRLGYSFSPEQAEKHRAGVPRGEDQHFSKLTWAQVREIRALRLERYETALSIGRRYGVNHATISDMLRNNTWYDPEYDPSKILPQGWSGDRARNRKITAKDVSDIRALRQREYLPCSEIAKEYGISKDMVYRIIKNLNWYDPEYDPTTLALKGGK